MNRAGGEPYPPIADYGFLSDCHSVALVSRAGSIDWCALPRLDSPPCFGRLLDWSRGGFYRIAPAVPTRIERRYLPGTLVLETTFHAESGVVRLTDAFAMHRGGRRRPLRRLLRMIEGIEGEVPIEVEFLPRFDFAKALPWLRIHDERTATALGGDDGLVLVGEVPWEIRDRHDLVARVAIARGRRIGLTLRYDRPERLYPHLARSLRQDDAPVHLEATIEWWKSWAAQARIPVARPERIVVSAAVLKGLTNAPTGAIAAAATTSLPEEIGGARNWDYRATWVRDSSFAARTLAEIGFEREADGFRWFIERSAAGSGAALRIMYGLGGEVLLPEVELDHLDGYRSSKPVRIGNAASEQRQLDVYGELLELGWHWHRRRRRTDLDYWRFLVDVVDEVTRVWNRTDRGIWEVRGDPRHFVYSKLMCWGALDRAVRLVEDEGLPGPADRWREIRQQLGAEIEASGFDPERGNLVQSFDSRALDASLLLAPHTGFLAWDDPRMVATADAIRDELTEGGFVLRYRSDDGLAGREGVFLACSFWLAEAFARQRRRAEAEEWLERTAATANDLGLFAEELDPKSRELLGNFPQALTHYAFISAALAVERSE